MSEANDPSSASDSAVGSASEDLSISAALPFDRFDTTPEAQEPQYVWVKYAAENAPDDGLDYRGANDGSEQAAPQRSTEAARPGQGPRREKPPSINVVRIDLSPDEAYVDQRSGVLERKLFIRLARRNAFPAAHVGNRYLAKLKDVQRYVEGHRLHARPATPEGEGSDVNELDEIRRTVGLRPKGTR